MPEELVFWMGKYEAKFPTDRLYARNHMWYQPIADAPGRYRVGFTAFSIRLLRDVYFLDWSVEPGALVKAKQQIGEIESSKAISSLYLAVDATIVAFNQALLDDPSAINVDGYGAGWLLELETHDDLLTPEEYLETTHAGWDETQRMIKGQMNQD
jgi:glycine cleavage system H protein